MRDVPTGFDQLLMRSIPDLRAYAQSLCRDATLADDIVQDALLNAWKNRTSLREIDRIKPWLLTIVRNAFLAHIRKNKPEVEDADGAFAAQLVSPPEQPAAAELNDVKQALAKLPIDEREAIVLVCIDRLSYAEAAEVCGCPAGTMKSRVNRARTNLTAVLEDKASDTSELSKGATGAPRQSTKTQRATLDA